MQGARTEGRTNQGVMSIKVGSIVSVVKQTKQLTLVFPGCAFYAEHDRDQTTDVHAKLREKMCYYRWDYNLFVQILHTRMMHACVNTVVEVCPLGLTASAGSRH